MSLAGKFTDVLPDGQGAHLGGHVHVDNVSTHAPPGAIIVPDAHLLFTGDFKRAGVDLILLETFGSLLEAAEAVRAVRGLSAEIPIVVAERTDG